MGSCQEKFSNLLKLMKCVIGESMFDLGRNVAIGVKCRNPHKRLVYVLIVLENEIN